MPERLEIKHELYRDIEDALEPQAIVASSASGLTLTEMQGGWRSPGRFVLGHPFNPPHLIPLVEVLGNDHTHDGVVATARAFYESVGKVTIEVRKEVPGHVANRLQAALWREAISLAANGVASVEDVDTAVWAGPGLRWAVMGPTMLFISVPVREASPASPSATPTASTAGSTTSANSTSTRRSQRNW